MLTPKTNNQNDISELVQKEDWQGVKNIFEQLLNEPLSKEEKGWVYLNLAMIYIHLNNIVNKNYNSILSDVLESIKKTSSLEKTT